jgi:nicotinate-nucleotide adenylyltransferase
VDRLARQSAQAAHRHRAFLKSRNPLVRYVWIMGADNLASFHRWERWREIFTMVPVVVVDRPGWRMKALASKAARAFAAARVPESEAAGLAKRPAPAWTFLTGPLSHVSSTALRNKGKRPGESGSRRAQAGEPPELPWKKKVDGESTGASPATAGGGAQGS